MAKGNTGTKTAEAKAKTSAAKTYASAMDKLRDEMATDNSRYVQVVGEYLTEYLLEHPEAEEALLNSAKTIYGSLKQIEAEVRKTQKGSFGFLTDVEGFGMVLEYFGIDGDATGKTSSVTTLSAAPPSPEGKALGETPAPDPFDLDALLGVV